jgi:hypothetical protein
MVVSKANVFGFMVTRPVSLIACKISACCMPGGISKAIERYETN